MLFDLEKWLAVGEMLKREAPSTAEKYPRILERFHYLWDSPDDCSMCFDNLFVMNGTDRAGFPPDVMEELMHLRRLCERGQAGARRLTPLQT